MTTTFINGDLDISARRDLQPLVNALDRVGLFNLNDGLRRGRRWFASFELKSPHPSARAETCARAILRRLERLDHVERRELRACTKRVLNFGYDTGSTWAFEDALSVDTIARLAAFQIGVAFTLYPEPGAK